MYFVYLKLSRPMDRRKIPGIRRRGFLQSFPNREARKKSARAEGERFFVEARFGERRNTLCIARENGAAQREKVRRPGALAVFRCTLN